MYAVKASCPVCGLVTVASSTMSLLVRPDGSGHLSFRCPQCRDMVTQECDHDIVRSLRSVRCPETTVESSGIGEAPLTEDELIDFGRRIEGDEDPWTELAANASLRLS